MLLTKKSQYAVMALTEVAEGSNQSPIRLSQISKNQSIPLNYLEQIFFKLKKANLVRSKKGPGGGYYLNLPTKNISVERILDAVEENFKMTRCAKDKKCRKNGISCKTHDVWKGLGVYIREYFSSISVFDIIVGNVGINSSIIKNTQHNL